MTLLRRALIGVAVLALLAAGWAGITTFQGGTQTPEDWRVGVRLYRRPESRNE